MKIEKSQLHWNWQNILKPPTKAVPGAFALPFSFLVKLKIAANPGKPRLKMIVFLGIVLQAGMEAEQSCGNRTELDEG